MEKKNKEPLKLLCLIVNKERTKFYIKRLIKFGMSEVYDTICLSSFLPNELTLKYDNKSLIACVNTNDKVEKCIFEFEKHAKNDSVDKILFVMPLNSIIGNLIYDYLTNTFNNGGK
jgi:hypothetical protein